MSHLQHTALTQPWSIRVAAVQSIAKVGLLCLRSPGAQQSLLLLHSRYCVMMRCCAHCADCSEVRGAISAAILHCAARSGGDRYEDQPRCSRSAHVCWLTCRGCPRAGLFCWCIDIRHCLTHMSGLLCDRHLLFGTKHILSRAAVLLKKNAALAYKLTHLPSSAQAPLA